MGRSSFATNGIQDLNSLASNDATVFYKPIITYKGVVTLGVTTYVVTVQVSGKVNVLRRSSAFGARKRKTINA